ncbi:MAG: calcium-transporting P-type ATPase, PMR1-type [Thermodesulfobacteriota bacterium]
MDWYRKSASQTLEELDTSAKDGLSSAEVKARLDKYGPNALAAAEKESRFVKFLQQFTQFIILVLIGAAVIAGLLGEWVDSIAIMAIVVMNGIIGFTQEEKAERVLEALKRMAAPRATVIRDGEHHSIDAADLVPGDIAILDAGDNIPADCRVIDSKLMRVEEAALTGESHPVDKDTQAIEGTLPLGDRINTVYSGTTVVYGRGTAVVTATGMTTEMGKIAKMLQEVKTEPTPLQKKLDEFGKYLVYAAGAVCGLIFLLGLLRGDDLLELFLTAVSLAVAAIPEGLPAVVTIVLALGVQRMVKRHALIRKLPSVETLGAATIIASDKTGTLTQNQMTVKKMYLSSGKVVDVSGSGYEPTGGFFVESSELDPAGDAPLGLALKAGLLCNSANLKKADDGWQVIGDPTEGALITLAMKGGLDRKTLEEELKLTGEIPFDAERKMMTTVYEKDGRSTVFVKGAPEKILPLCTEIFDSGSTRPMEEADRGKISGTNEEFARTALRVLALAYRESPQTDGALDVHKPQTVENNLVFVGLVGMIDPPREEVFVSVEKAKAAGITPIMITGDHKLTAIAIAREIDAFGDDDMALTGTELDAMSEEEFERLLPRIKVYARVNPEHKLQVVRAWRNRGETIAMTGDGVNDAPALKEADIGVAMGITGTDVTKEAADMVLTDDNFSSIVSAVEEGRGIFDNIRKVIHFLLSCNIGEIITLLVASLTGMPLPLLPVQILWMNLVTDGLPALGLAMEPVDPGVMDKKPRKKDEGIITPSLLRVMTIQGTFMAVCTLVVYALELYWFDGGLERARTLAFMVLVYCQMFHVFNCRSERESVFAMGFFSNRLLNLSVAVIMFSQILLVYVPVLQPIFKVVALRPSDWLIIFVAAVQPLIWMEAIKMMQRDKKPGV